MDNPFWDYSNRVYALKGVPDLCLALQDNHAVDVNLLLYGAWLAEQDRVLTGPHMAALEARVGHWRGDVVAPLRRLRQGLREVVEARHWREALQRLELEAERYQQDLMYECFRAQGSFPGASRPLCANLAAAAALGGGEPAGRARLTEQLATLLREGGAPAGPVVT